MDSSESAGGFPRRWRVSAAGRGLAAVVIVGFVGAALFVALDSYRVPGDGPYDHYVVALVFALMGLSTWRGSFYPYIAADTGGLTVRNPLRTRRLRWSEIRDVRPGYGGLWIQIENERSMTAWAVQEANVASWLRRPTRSKRVANEIKDLASVQSGSGEQRPV